MAVRVRIARDKAELVQILVENKDSTGAFQTYADVLAFAAALGAKEHKRLPLEAIALEPSPISLEIFVSRGYDSLIKLLAIAETKEAKILSAYEPNAEENRALIFEEYANGGLEKIQQELKGAIDYTERILLLLSAERAKDEYINEDFDLSRFL